MAPRVSMLENTNYEPLKTSDLYFKKKRLTNNDAESKVSSLLMKKTTSQGVSPQLNLEPYIMLPNDESN